MKRKLFFGAFIFTLVLAVLNPLFFYYQKCKIVVKTDDSYETFVFDVENKDVFMYINNDSPFPIGRPYSYGYDIPREYVYHDFGIVSVPFRTEVTDTQENSVLEKKIKFDNKNYHRYYSASIPLYLTDMSSKTSKESLIYCEIYTDTRVRPKETTICYGDKILRVTFERYHFDFDGDPFTGVLTEEQAIYLFEKYQGTLLNTKTDSVSEYRLEPEETESEYMRLLAEYEKEEADETLTPSEREDRYVFRKYVDGIPTYETVHITKTYSAIDLSSFYSAPITSEDMTEWDDEKITQKIDDVVNNTYEISGKGHGDIISINSSERYLAKAITGQRSVVSYVIAEFEDGEKSLMKTVTFLERAYVYDSYTLAAFITVQAVIMILSYVCIVFIPGFPENRKNAEADDNLPEETGSPVQKE